MQVARALSLRRDARALRRRRKLIRLLGLAPGRDTKEPDRSSSSAIISPVDSITTVTVLPAVDRYACSDAAPVGGS
jgi:hypothetical protein